MSASSLTTIPIQRKRTSFNNKGSSMKNIILALALILCASHAFAASKLCHDLQKISSEFNSDFLESNQVTIQTILEGTSPTSDLKNYERTNFLLRNECLGAMTQTLFTIASENKLELEAIISTDDLCDGGNSYGLIRIAKTKEVVAFVSDSFIDCE